MKRFFSSIKKRHEKINKQFKENQELAEGEIRRAKFMKDFLESDSYQYVKEVFDELSAVYEKEAMDKQDWSLMAKKSVLSDVVLEIRRIIDRGENLKEYYSRQK